MYSDMINLRDETVDMVKKVNKVPDYVVWDYGKWCSYHEFLEKAKDFTYDSGYGLAMVNESLCVVFTDGTWLSREEYDGSEWWRLNECPKKVCRVSEVSMYDD